MISVTMTDGVSHAACCCNFCVFAALVGAPAPGFGQWLRYPTKASRESRTGNRTSRRRRRAYRTVIPIVGHLARRNPGSV